MAKFYGAIGFIDTVESKPGVFETVSEERPVQGDILRDNRRWESSDHLNDDITINNRFEFVADDYMYEHYSLMRYLVWNGTKWKISGQEIRRPRIIINVRGVWNGN